MPIVHSSQVIGMEEKPVEALRKKRDNSISRCWGLMAAGEVDAVVSAGNTGAMVASALFNAKMFLPGVRRPGIAAIFPSHQGPIVIIDVGANMNAKAEDLYQYGIMGAIYAEEILGVTGARIGLLNVGTEDEKGTELTRTTLDIYQASPWASRFVGNVEGRDIYEGHVRVVICDGFVGNVLLKAGEGAVEFLFSALKEELARIDARTARRLRPEVRHEPEAAQDAVRIRGVRRRAAAGHPRRLHHLPRRVGRPGDQERPPRRRHHGLRTAARPDRRAAWRGHHAPAGRDGTCPVGDRGHGGRSGRRPSLDSGRASLPASRAAGAARQEPSLPE